MATFWFNGSNIVVNGSNEPIDCATCPCGTCCDGVPETLTLTMTGTGDYACFDGITVTYTYDASAVYNIDGGTTYYPGWKPTSASVGISDGTVYHSKDITTPLTCGSYTGIASFLPLVCLGQFEGGTGYGGYSSSTNADPLDNRFSLFVAGLNSFPNSTTCAAQTQENASSCDPFSYEPTCGCIDSGMSPSGTVSVAVTE